MTRLIKKECDRCNTVNELDLDELVGMPLRNTLGEITDRPLIDLDKPIHVECDQCGGPFVVTKEDVQ